MLLDPLNLLDRVVDIVEEDLPDARPPLREPAAEVLEPPVVSPDAGPAPFVLVRLGRPGEQHEAREERRDRVRKITSPTTPSLSCCELRMSSSQLRSLRSSPRSRNGFLYLLRQASNSSRNLGSRNSRYWAWLPPACVSEEMRM